jgi:hypothetical protein
MLSDEEEARFAAITEELRQGGLWCGSVVRAKWSGLVVVVSFIGLLLTFTWSAGLGLACCVGMFVGVLGVATWWPRSSAAVSTTGEHQPR